MNEMILSDKQNCHKDQNFISSKGKQSEGETMGFSKVQELSEMNSVHLCINHSEWAPGLAVVASFSWALYWKRKFSVPILGLQNEDLWSQDSEVFVLTILLTGFQAFSNLRSMGVN